MTQVKQLLPIIEQMKGSQLKNYIIAGLDSTLLNNGKVRLFECNRNHLDSITPHSHRYDLTCIVLCGEVENTLFTESNKPENADQFVVSKLTYTGSVGSFRKESDPAPKYFKSQSHTYREGSIYCMTADDIHSIRFKRDTKVLVFEGEIQTDTSLCLEPRVNGEHIVTLEKKPYMYKVNV
ncbi:hypothetical protein ALT721_800034 [Alteromonas alvinellae]